MLGIPRQQGSVSPVKLTPGNPGLATALALRAHTGQWHEAVVQALMTRKAIVTAGLYEAGL
eukprot:gene7682-7883_t